MCLLTNIEASVTKTRHMTHFPMQLNVAVSRGVSSPPAAAAAADANPVSRHILHLLRVHRQADGELGHHHSHQLDLQHRRGCGMRCCGEQRERAAGCPNLGRRK